MFRTHGYSDTRARNQCSPHPICSLMSTNVNSLHVHRANNTRTYSLSLHWPPSQSLNSLGDAAGSLIWGFLSSLISISLVVPACVALPSFQFLERSRALLPAIPSTRLSLCFWWCSALQECPEPAFWQMCIVWFGLNGHSPAHLMSALLSVYTPLRAPTWQYSLSTLHSISFFLASR